MSRTAAILVIAFAVFHYNASANVIKRGIELSDSANQGSEVMRSKECSTSAPISMILLAGEMITHNFLVIFHAQKKIAADILRCINDGVDNTALCVKAGINE